MSDVVAELDAELALIAELPYRVPIHLLARRARDEIVELRERLEELLARLEVLPGIIRDEALESAALLCLRKARDHVIPIGQDNYYDGCVSCAAATRALKERTHD